MPSSPQPPPPLTTPPYTLHEALYGLSNLHPRVSHLHQAFPAHVHARFQRFHGILNRPKQSIHHLFELFIITVCQLETPTDPPWLNNLLDYLASACLHLIPAIPQQASKLTEYPSSIQADAKLILDILRTYTSSFVESQIQRNELACMTGNMDEPAKTALMAYAWMLDVMNINNGWLRPYLTAAIGCRNGKHEQSVELFTLYSPPFVDVKGHVKWYTVRKAQPNHIIGRQAQVYAINNRVVIVTDTQIDRSIQIHHSQLCNRPRFDLRLWTTWTAGGTAIGPFAGLGKKRPLGKPVRFDAPVRIDDAIAVGYRVRDSRLLNPAGKLMNVSKSPHGYYRAKLVNNHSHSGHSPQESVQWHMEMKFV